MNYENDITKVEKIEKFYKLKTKYDNKIKKKKQTIIKNENLNTKQKKELIQSLNIYCVKCNNKGGTDFKITNKILSAVCNSNPKCNLNMVIDKELYYNIRNEYYKVVTLFDNLKINLIKIKNNTINSLISEEDSLSEFLKYEKQFKKLQEEKANLYDKYITIINNEDNNRKLSELNTELNDNVGDIKTNLINYSETNNNIYIINSINIYEKNIMAINKNIMNLKYYNLKIECEDDMDIKCKKQIFKLNTDKYTIENFYTTTLN
jgi:hypothetical protein